jgi:ADP-ribose pyrophosphatase YjhB (NUDIX family)
MCNGGCNAALRKRMLMKGDEGMPEWVQWAREIQALAQTGLAHTEGRYDKERYSRLMHMAAEMTARYSGREQGELEKIFMAQPGYATPKVDVRGAVIKDGKILLVQERSDGLWCMPGGWADVGDLPSAMVAREVREESGLEVTPRKLCGVFDANRSGRPLEFFHAYKLVFLCELKGGELSASDETAAAEFFRFDGLPPLSMNRTNPRHLEEVRAHLADPSRATAFD